MESLMVHSIQVRLAQFSSKFFQYFPFRQLVGIRLHSQLQSSVDELHADRKISLVFVLVLSTLFLKIDFTLLLMASKFGLSFIEGSSPLIFLLFYKQWTAFGQVMHFHSQSTYVYSDIQELFFLETNLLSTVPQLEQLLLVLRLWLLVRILVQHFENSFTDNSMSFCPVLTSTQCAPPGCSSCRL